MQPVTSSHFASAASSGEDWREAVKGILLQLDKIGKKEMAEYTIGFLYISDLLRDDARSILSLLRSVTKVDHWVGSTGIGICASGSEYLDEPAISVMLGKIPKSQFKTFHESADVHSSSDQGLAEWLEKNEAMLTLVHGDYDKEFDPGGLLESLQRKTSGFILGGISSSREKTYHISEEVLHGGFSGVTFSSGVQVATSLTQGCSPMGPVHIITRTEGSNTIIELDNQRAIEVFIHDLKNMAEEKTGQNPDNIIIKAEALEDPDKAPENYRRLFQGQVHVAFPVTGSDQRDYIVRNIVAADPHFGHLRVAHEISSGDRMLFVHRDNETIRADLSRTLVALRKRIVAERGSFSPKGAIFISCLARAYSALEESALEEMKLIKEIIGEIPLSGFYAGGEISNNRLYNYTGVLTLFF